MSGVSTKNLTRRKRAPRFAYTEIAKHTLPGWDISLVFVDSRKARALNKQLRGKIYTPNVLSYALSGQSGEIFICLSEAEKQASAYNMDGRTFVLYLFIHGILHIKGWAHGVRMEQCEQNLLTRFGGTSARVAIHEATSNHRHRHRNLPGKNGGHRGAHR